MRAINNLSTRKRIFGIFAIVLIVAMSIGVLGIISANTLGSEISDMYHHDTEPIAALSHVIQNVMALSSSFDMAILAAMSGDYDEVKAFEDSVNQLYIETDTLLRNTQDEIYNNDAQILYDSAFQKYYDTLVPTGPKMFLQLYAGDLVTAEEIMGAADVSIGEMTDEFKQCLDKKVDKAKIAFEKNEASVKTTITLLIVILSVGFIVTIFLAVLLSKSITKPMQSMLRFAKETSETGNLELSTREIENVAKRGDEIGITVRAFCEMTAMFREQATVLKTVSSGDFTPVLTLKSQADTVGVSLNTMLDEIGMMLRDVSAASQQVAQGVSQIADGSSDLSNSISEQNTSIENISSSLHHINEQVKSNMESSNSAKELVTKMSKEAQNGDKKMADMVQAVHKINEASGGIGKIMKTIDDIAFQTNILALNAAVEAARAGQHGKGFAVVAEEVRNLASKSAGAAAESNALISSALQLTESGVQIAEDTRKSIETITSGIQNVLLLIEQMSDAAKNQSFSIAQLDNGVVEISEIIQRTSSNAEQSSAACEEISSLSVSLDEMVARFKLRSDPVQLPRHY